ncbi:MAG: hypothetical protein OEX18_02800 [Candidatus Krumholzibacteria bacterium]|nr:hypothetical protein [Candidatus Krumholzibacteria bacterium]MDH4336186.1 hypothetical protein [Candidatus Krumholzibacteria bacterium]MDH5268827.1 hypothetical protein [Candidatus Krumholzibacteria bacterium]
MAAIKNVPTRTARALALGLVISLGACGSDSPSDSGGPPSGVSCPEVQGTPIEINISRFEWEGATVEYNGASTTTYQNRATVTGVSTPVVGPGDRVLVRVSFANPLEYVSEDPWLVSFVVQGGFQGGYRGEATIQPPLFTGDWPLASPFAHCDALEQDWVLTAINMSVRASPAKGERLNCIVFDCTIPAQLNIGATPVAAAIPIDQIIWYAVRSDGDHSGDPPPIEAVKR